MKFCIVTLPIHGNYGGMLQAYALRSVCSTTFLDSETNLYNTHYAYCHKRHEDLFTHLCNQLKLYIGRLYLLCLPSPVVLYTERKATSLALAKEFYCKNCLRSKLGKEIDFSKSDAFIVGSDQVWRKCYTLDLLYKLYGLGFATRGQRQRSISYAASFGTDEWEGTPEETKRFGELLRQFKAVSVREFSGVRICKEVFGVDAVQMPDPTLLATLEDYERVINSEKTRVPKAPYFASYVLDDSTEASQLLGDVEKGTGLYHQRLLPKSTARKRWDRFYCTVAQWLRYLRDCDAVVTDSFHGCVFSIIYNKPFVCLGNEGRGSARFDTLFQVFGLENRLVASRDPEEVLRVLRQPIDWQRVNAIHEAERQRGLDFLRSNLYDGASPDEQG